MRAHKLFIPSDGIGFRRGLFSLNSRRGLPFCDLKFFAWL